MIEKFLEIRDEGTCIPVLCIEMRPGRYVGLEALFRVEYCFLDFMGFEQHAYRSILLIDPQGKRSTYNPADWKKPAFGSGRTLYEAHLYIKEHWDRLGSGDVVDVAYLKGETKAPATSSILKG